MPPCGRDAPDCTEDLGLKDKFGRVRRTLIQKMDVKSAFRQVGVDPGKGRYLRVCCRGLPVCRHADAIRVEGEPRVVGGDSTLQQAVLGFDLDTEKMTLSLPARKSRELQELLEDWPPWKRTATEREVLVLAGKMYHVAYVIRPVKYSVRRLLQLSNLHLNGQEKRGGEGGVRNG